MILIDFDDLYYQTIQYIEEEYSREEKLRRYIEWELHLLRSLGFGLDLDKCVVSGSKEDLKFVSPKTGCAVSSKSSSGWEKKLLVLPEFLVSRKSAEIISLADLESGFKLTEYFIRKSLQPVKSFQIDKFFRSRNRVLSLN